MKPKKILAVILTIFVVVMLLGLIFFGIDNRPLYFRIWYQLLLILEIISYIFLKIRMRLMPYMLMLSAAVVILLNMSVLIDVEPVAKSIVGSYNYSITGEPLFDEGADRREEKRVELGIVTVCLFALAGALLQMKVARDLTCHDESI